MFHFTFNRLSLSRSFSVYLGSLFPLLVFYFSRFFFLSRTFHSPLSRSFSFFSCFWPSSIIFSLPLSFHFLFKGSFFLFVILSCCYLVPLISLLVSLYHSIFYYFFSILVILFLSSWLFLCVSPLYLFLCVSLLIPVFLLMFLLSNVSMSSRFSNFFVVSCACLLLVSHFSLLFPLFYFVLFMSCFFPFLYLCFFPLCSRSLFRFYPVFAL